MFDAARRTAYADFPTHFARRHHNTSDATADLGARLNWLVAFHAYDDYRRSLFRDSREEEEMSLMRRPYATEKAYKLFGLLLGALPPAAIFYRLFGGELISPHFQWDWFLLLAIMNVVCCLAGRWIGAVLGKRMDMIGRSTWSFMLFSTLLIGFLWGLAAGAAGGLIFFGIGAFFGAACAVPVGMLGFLLFTLLHRLMVRGGMIDARHFWPLACGVASVIAALILSPHIFPY